MRLSLVAALIGISSAIDTFANVTIYEPDSPNTVVTYARTESLPNNTVLAIWNDPSEANDTIAIYQSTDSGFSWYPFGTATSDTAGRRLVQPYLLYVNESFGDYDAGTVLLAVNAMDSTSTNIEIYASQDLGQTFALVSSVAQGGPANSAKGATPVREPFLLLNDHKIICYYTDQRDTLHGQKLSHQTTSSDFDSYGSAIDDVAFQNSTNRPGMTTVAKLPNGQFILTFEYGQLGGNGHYSYPVYYKIASNPENFASQPAQRLVANTGTKPSGGPYVTWSPLGGSNGTIVVSDSNSNSVFVNTDLGQNNWTEITTVAARAYSREVKIPNNDNTKLRIAGGADSDQDSASQILVTVLDFAKLLGIAT